MPQKSSSSAKHKAKTSSDEEEEEHHPLVSLTTLDNSQVAAAALAEVSKEASGVLNATIEEEKGDISEKQHADKVPEGKTKKGKHKASEDAPAPESKDETSELGRQDKETKEKTKGEDSKEAKEQTNGEKEESEKEKSPTAPKAVSKQVLVVRPNDANFSHLLEGKTFAVYGKTDAAKDVKMMAESLGAKVTSEMGPGVIPLVRSASTAVPAEFDDGYTFDLIYFIHKRGKMPDFAEFKVKRPPNLPGNVKINTSELTDAEKSKQSADIKSVAESLPLPPAHTATKRTRKASARSKAASPSAESEYTTPKKRSSKFTKTEDEAILDLVRRNPYLRSTHSFYAQIAQIPLLSNHTGNSIRFRFRKILSKRIDWVYKVDPVTNQIQLDPETNEPIKIKHLPGLLKSQYTAEEDYNLCKAVLDFKENGSNLSTRKRRSESTVPEIVFKQMAEKYPRHSIMSWRDRYRKFASVYGLEKYVKYYDDCLATDTKPKPMRNLSSRAQNRQKRRRSPLDLANEEQKVSKKPKVEDTKEENGKNVSVSVSDLGAAQIQELARASVEKDADNEEKDVAEAKDGTSESSKKPDSTADSVLSQSANLFEDADEMKALNIDFTGSLSSHNGLTGTITLSSLKKAEPEPIEDREKVNVEETIKDIEDLFSDFGSDIRSSDQLCEAIHKKTGISASWLSYWFDCSCGMINVFLDVVQNYLKTGELIMKNHAGFWTEGQDRMLLDESKLPDLYKLHGTDSVNKRRAALVGQPSNVVS